MPSLDRRSFLQAGLGAGAGAAAASAVPATRMLLPRGKWFQISLAQWSLHRAHRKGEFDNLGFPAEAKKLGFEAIEYVNQFFKDKASDIRYLGELRARCDDAGVKSLLIMCDGEGRLGDPDAAKRQKAIENHYRWVAAAKLLDCHSIRVNAASAGTYDEQRDRAADGLRRLTEFAADYGISVLVENHGGLSSNGAWLAAVMKRVDHPYCGTLPDFGNFNLGRGKQYDRYQGMRELMPFAKAVSAKAHRFDDAGNEVNTDYAEVMKIVKDAGYRGWIGVEFEGGKISERKGILATKRLLERYQGE